MLKILSVILATLAISVPSLAGNWKDEAGTDLVRPTATATQPSTSPRAQPGKLVYFEYTAGGDNPPPLDIKSCKDVIIMFHPDYAGDGDYDAEAKAWDCLVGAPTIDASVAAFDEELYCGRILGNANGVGGPDDTTLNGDDGTDRDGDYLKQFRFKIVGARGNYLHIEHSTDPSGADTTRTVVICAPETR